MLVQKARNCRRAAGRIKAKMLTDSKFKGKDIKCKSNSKMTYIN